MNPFVFVVLGAILLVLLYLAHTTLRVVQPYERGIISVLGRLSGAKGRGLLPIPHTRNVNLRLTPNHLSDDTSDTFFL